MAGRNGRTAFTYETYIAATPQAVWRGLTDANVTERYFYGLRFEAELKKGAAYAFVGDGEASVTDGKILDVVPGKRLRMSWRARYDDKVSKDAPSRVTYELEPAGKATRLRVVHDRFEGETATYRSVIGGWPAVLSSLKTMLESGKPISLT